MHDDVRQWGERSIRILHTADWHLGHELAGWSREREQRQVLDEIAQRAIECKADVLIVAGDVFDHQNPSGAMYRMLFEFFDRLADAAPQLVSILVAGNHDAAGRLEAPRPLFRRANVHAIGALEQTDGHIDLERHLIDVRRNGEIVGHVLAIPYLRAADLPDLTSIDEKEGALPIAAAIERFYNQAIDAARRECKTLPLAVTGHLHVRGASLSESLSERRILAGGEQAVPAKIFGTKADYIALGHLHRAQSVGNGKRRDRVRYAGSPMPLSAVEREYEHGVALVEINADNCTVEHLPLIRPVPFLRLPKTGRLRIDGLEEALAGLELAKDGPQHEWPFVQIYLQIDKPEPGLRGRLDEICASFPIRNVNPDIARPEAVHSRAASHELKRLNELGPEELFVQAFEARHGLVPDEQHIACFRRLIEEAG